jgi:hypothetical protein
VILYLHPAQIRALADEQIRALISTLTDEQIRTLRSALIEAQKEGAVSDRSEDQTVQERTKKNEEISTPIKPPDTYSKAYHLNKIENTDAQLALNRLLEEMEKRSSVLIKFFPGAIAIFIGTNKIMHITPMPSYFSLRIYYKFEGELLSGFQKIFKTIKIDSDGITLKIENANQIDDFIKFIDYLETPQSM